MIERVVTEQAGLRALSPEPDGQEEESAAAPAPASAEGPRAPELDVVPVSDGRGAGLRRQAIRTPRGFLLYL